MTELVVAINRTELLKQGVGNHGIYPISIQDIDPFNYSLLPRTFADNKSLAAIALGAAFPQILGYIQVVNHEGKYLAYQRKGKEEGLFGKWSIGVGGHINQEELMRHSDTYEDYDCPPLKYLIVEGTHRELEEELGVSMQQLAEAGIDAIEFDLDKVISSNLDQTSMVHVGLPGMITLHETTEFNLDPAEFCNFTWLSVDELKANDREYENWSNLLIAEM